MRQVTIALFISACVASTAAAQVSGTVVDASNDTPLSDARVTIQATERHTRTGPQGRFSFESTSDGPLVLVGAHKGHYNGSITVEGPTSGVAIRLDPVPTGDDPDHAFRSPEDCATCHQSQYDQWRFSPMKHSGVNTWVHDIYAGNGTSGGDNGFVYTRDSIHATENPESECASCHQPLTWLDSPPAALAPPDSGTPAVDNGVSCVVCHQTANVDMSRPMAPGMYPDVVTMTRPSDPEVPIAYGVLGDVDYRDPDMRAAYNPQLPAETCAACHQDANDPDRDGDFTESGSVISEPTYLEWERTPYADPSSEHYATCADCHMAPTEASQACNQDLPYSREPGRVRSHRIEGTTPRFLENAVTLMVNAHMDDGALVVEATIRNDQTGHDVPTGVTIRNMILLVEAFDDTGQRLEHTGDQVVHELGGVGDPSEGDFAGLPGKLYGKINHGADGTGPVFYTEATGIIRDNRIAPFDSDSTHYTFRAPASGEMRVKARLIYRRTWPRLAEAKGWTQDGHGEPLEDLQPPHFGHLMESAELEVSRNADAGPATSASGSSGGCRIGAGGAPPCGGALLLLTFVLWPARRRVGSGSQTS